MIFILFILLILLIVIIFIIIGKPREIDYKIDKYLDSFEKTDYDNGGRVKHDYLAWNFQEYTINIRYWVLYKWYKNPFNWKNTVSVKLDSIELPEGFDITLIDKNDNYRECPWDYEMPLINSNDFLVKIKQIDNHIDLTKPQLVKFDIKIIGVNFNARKTIYYNFLVGRDIGKGWVAFDPGTTATTIAFGNPINEMVLAKNKQGFTLTPSVLVFEKNDTNISFYGNEASERIRETSRYFGFRSIKKLLGYKDINKETGKTGKELAEKLVSDIYSDTKQSNFEIKNYKRAIVAIPNNYTAAKTKDMLSCVESLEQFDEIRTIYEPEAILFYYRSNKSALEREFECRNSNENEVVLVFDMGGATINATVAQISKQDGETYEVNILSKIGYGIGGDSIDYCILKSIFEFEKELNIQHLNIFDNEIRSGLSQENLNSVKEKLIFLSFRIKQEITKNLKKAELISANDLHIFLTEAADKQIYIDADSDFFRIFKRSSRFCLLRNKLFVNLIYNNICDAVNEVIKIAGNPKVDKIILAGRSTSFPNIEENIIGTFSYSPDLINLNKTGMAKTAVVEGAYWYGMNNNCIKLNNLKTSSNFGFVYTKSPDKQNIQFVNLISAGQNFKENEVVGIKSTHNTILYHKEFSFDGGRVNFYQVMGNDCETIIAQELKHKFSKIASIKLNQESKEIEMKVSENDDVLCSVRQVNEETDKLKHIVADQEIAEANEEHYTWILNM